MIVLTDCLTDHADEGCVKVASSLVRRLKHQCPETTVITYGRRSALSDLHLQPGPLFLDSKLLRLLRQKQEQILYIPFSSNTKAAVLRTFLLEKLTGSQVNVLFALRWQMDMVTRHLLYASGARVLCLSQDSWEVYRAVVGDRAVLLKAGVDTRRFVPMDAAGKARLRRKFGVLPDKKVLLHVGHLKEERNLRQLLNVGEDYHIVLVVSTLTAGERDESLRRELEERPNTTIIDTFMPDVQQVYQMADVYFFPVALPGQCIDLPLSVLEATACNVPVVAGQCDQLREFEGKDGFWFTGSYAPMELNSLLDKAAEGCPDARSTALPYDWANAAQTIREVCGI